MTKSANYRIRVEPDLHREFLAACKSEDRPAAQVIREFMKNYVAERRFSRQADLFEVGQSQGGSRGGASDE